MSKSLKWGGGLQAPQDTVRCSMPFLERGVDAHSLAAVMTDLQDQSGEHQHSIARLQWLEMVAHSHLLPMQSSPRPYSVPWSSTLTVCLFLCSVESVLLPSISPYCALEFCRIFGVAVTCQMVVDKQLSGLSAGMIVPKHQEWEAQLAKELAMKRSQQRNMAVRRS